VTHVVYAALFELPGLFRGWLEDEQILRNGAMCRNFFEPLLATASSLDHISLLHGTKAYGIPSVLVQLSCEVELVRPISRNVFRPVPNVDSALVRMRRIAPAPNDELAALVHDAFAHRRKTLPRSLEEAGGPAGIREAAREALEDIGHPPDARAETLSPDDFAQLERELRRPG